MEGFAAHSRVEWVETKESERTANTRVMKDKRAEIMGAKSSGAESKRGATSSCPGKDP